MHFFSGIAWRLPPTDAQPVKKKTGTLYTHLWSAIRLSSLK